MTLEYGEGSNRERKHYSGTMKDVLDGGFCVGCGACAAASDDAIKMKLNDVGALEPDISEADLSLVSSPKYNAICPFLAEGPHETELARKFATEQSVYNDKLGWYQALYAGHAAAGNFRADGSSGGLTSWLLHELKAAGRIDHVIEVRTRDLAPDGPRFEFKVAWDRDDIRASAKTRYYPVEISEVAAVIRSSPGRYAFVGVPCFVKAMKRLAKQEPLIAARLTVSVAIICGHLKSTGFGESLAWQLGCKPADIGTLDYRVKLRERPASKYGFSVTTKAGATAISPMDKLAGHDWGLGMFRLKACDYCDDVVGEAADVSFGDAWLPQYANDSQGTNIVIVRDPGVRSLFDAGLREGAIDIEPLSENDAIRSQDASFRHRRDGLAYRLKMADCRKQWRPWKRTQANEIHINFVQKAIFRFRAQASQESHRVFSRAKAHGELTDYLDFVTGCTAKNRKLKRALNQYNRVEGVLRRVLRRSRR